MDENFRHITAWCAQCQDDCPHSFWTDKNKELILSCIRCAHFIKVAEGVKDGAFAQFLAAHRTANSGQKTAPEVYSSAKDILMYQPVVEAVAPVATSEPLPEPKKKQGWFKKFFVS